MTTKVFIVSLMAVGVLAQFDLTDLMKVSIVFGAAKFCEMNNATDKTEDFVKAVIGGVDCVKALVDPNNITQEIDEAKPQGKLEVVFKKYCGKIPDFKVCLNSLSDGVKLCISEKNSGHWAEMRKVLESLLDFLCYKDGERMAMFFAESGPQCLKDKREKIEECRNNVQKTLTKDVEKISIEEQCDKFDELSSCAVKALEECSPSTPAKLVEALLKNIKNSTSCFKVDHGYLVEDWFYFWPEISLSPLIGTSAMLGCETTKLNNVFMKNFF